MQSKPKYISYERAMAQLREKFGATPEELAAWIFLSSQELCAAKDSSGERCCTNEVLHRGDKCELHGGELTQANKAELIEHKRHNLVAFTDAKELDPPPRFFFGNYAGERDYCPLLYRCWFKADAIATFEPGERFITGEKLLERWAARNALPPDERIKIASRESLLNPLHPTLGLTQATFSDTDYAPLEDGLFSLAEIKAYEREEFGGELDAMATGESGDAAGNGEGVKRGITKQQVINAFEGLHFDRNGWRNALEDVPNWIEPCRVTPGVQGSRASATWNPVLIAAALIDKDKKITRKKLDAVFVRLKDWADEWREVSESFCD